MLESFNIRDERGRFAQAMVDLLRLGHEAVGMDTAILKDELGQYIVLDKRSTAPAGQDLRRTDLHGSRRRGQGNSRVFPWSNRVVARVDACYQIPLEGGDGSF